MKAGDSPVDPTTVIGEILGEPSALMRNPVNADYQCPFINSRCVKKGKRSDEPYPICSIWRGKPSARQLVCVCPKRFFEAEICTDIFAHCWPGPRPIEYRLVYDVTINGYGRDEMIIADIDSETKNVNSFVSVKFQAIDISGSVESAYNAAINSKMLDRRPTSGLNEANVTKRFLFQLMTKGRCHSEWGSRIVAVLQASQYDRLRTQVPFDDSVEDDKCSIAFLLYDYVHWTDDGENRFQMSFSKCTKTNHECLISGLAAIKPPPRRLFCDKLIARLG